MEKVLLGFDNGGEGDDDGLDLRRFDLDLDEAVEIRGG